MTGKFVSVALQRRRRRKKGFEALSLSLRCEAFDGVVRRRFPGFHLSFLPKQTSSDDEGDVASRERQSGTERNNDFLFRSPR